MVEVLLSVRGDGDDDWKPPPAIRISDADTADVSWSSMASLSIIICHDEGGGGAAVYAGSAVILDILSHLQGCWINGRVSR